MKIINRRILCFLFTIYSFLLFSFSAVAQQNYGKIKGTVRTSDGDAAAGVNIILKNSKYGTVTNENGEFEFNRVKTSTYTLQVSLTGYETLEQEVSVSINETSNVDLKLNVSNKELNEVVVNTGRANKFSTLSSVNVSKIPLKNMENPQIYNVVNAALMKEQIVTNYQQALNNIPGAMTTTVGGGNGGTYIKMRGFYSTAGYRDGIPVVQFTSSDPVNIEKIEAVKGPVGALFGSLASYGGIVNRVTKKPYETFGGEISYSAGSYELSRLTLDINTPLDQEKTILFRLNGALHKENSFQDFGYKDNYTLTPSFLYKASDKLTLSLNTEIYQSKWIATYYNYSFPATMKNIKDLPIGYKQSLVGEGLESTVNSFNNYLKAEYQLSENWKSTTTFTTMQNKWQPHYFFGLNWNSADNTYTRTASKTEHTTFNTIDIQQNFNGEFYIGKLKNRVLIGFDYYNYEANFGNYGTQNYDIITLPSTSIAPISKPKFESMIAGLPYLTSSNGQTILSVYASEVIDITDKLTAMVSLRGDRFLLTTPVNNGVENSQNDYNQNSFSPKFGLVFQPVKDVVSLFVSYSNGFVNVAPNANPKDQVVNIFKPENANQFEGGIKAEAFNHKLSGSLSYFNILVNDKIRLDDTGVYFQDGSQRNSGIELDIQANPFKSFNITAGYAYLNAEYVKIATSLIGKTPSTSPKNIANLWANYKFNNGLGLGLGGNYSDKSYNTSNTFIFPSFTIINTSVFYEFKKVRLGLKINNIGNVKSWDLNYYPQQLRQFVGNITYKF